MSEPKIMPDEHGQCPPGYMWSGILQCCVPVEPAPTTAPAPFTVTMTLKKSKPPPTPLEVHVQLKKKPHETNLEALRSVVIMGFLIDYKLEALGQQRVYGPASERKETQRKTATLDKPMTFHFQKDGKLDEAANAVADELGLKYRTYAEPLEWKHRALMFQHLPLKTLQDMREDMQAVYRSLKHIETRAEIERAYDYLGKNLPIKELANIDEASQRWLKAMQLLKTAGFSFYVARQAADHVSFHIDKDHSYARYKFEDQSLNLPSTWDDPTIKPWREAEEKQTNEKEKMDAEYEENEKTLEALKPLLTKFINQGLTNTHIRIKLEAQNLPRQLMPRLMGDVTYIRFQQIQRLKPAKPAKTEDQPPKDPSKQVPKCPEGQHWSADQNKCMPNKPPSKQEGPTEDTRWNRPTIMDTRLLDKDYKKSN